ncbi:MAG: hypothetical protein Ct9H300mP1_03510 [Planctomycetaceae bacterium]|nr:MAG: hypothetical protein Ct9H300mP1_03510 [Planctomycetaceae bacterium]
MLNRPGPSRWWDLHHDLPGFDVVIAGGGVVGHATAWELARRDIEVLIVDRHLPGRATSASAGGLWPVGEAGGLGCGVIYQAARTGSDSGDAVPASLPAVFRDFLVESNRRFPELGPGEIKTLPAWISNSIRVRACCS